MVGPSARARGPGRRLKVLEDPGLAARVAAQGRDLVATRFSAARVAARMAEVCREVIALAEARG
jgi:hypothetical protein